MLRPEIGNLFGPGRRLWTILRRTLTRSVDGESIYNPLDLARRYETTCLDVYEAFCGPASDTSRKAAALDRHVTILALIEAQPEALRQDVETLLSERDGVPDEICADVELLVRAVRSVPETALEALLRSSPRQFQDLEPQARRFALALLMTGLLRSGGPRAEPVPRQRESAPRRRAA